MFTQVYSECQAIIDLIGEFSAQTGIDQIAIRKAVRVTTHHLSPDLAPAGAVEFGADLVRDYSREALESALASIR